MTSNNKFLFLYRYKKIFIRLILILIVVLGIIFVIWYRWFRVVYDEWGIPEGDVSYEYVDSQSEAKLYYPGSNVVAPFGNAEGSFTFAGAVIASNDSPEKIYRWYRTWLLAHGWVYDENAVGGLASTQISLQGYTRHGRGITSREVFYVAIDDPKMLGWTLGKKIPINTTVFEIQYAIRGGR